MDSKLVKQLEDEIAELQSRWPKHSVPPRMWQRLDELEQRLEEAIDEPENTEPEKSIE